jgi:BASS family bile acid:Na+ symporter
LLHAHYTASGDAHEICFPEQLKKGDVDSFYDVLILLSGAATFATMFGAAVRLGPEALHRVVEHPRLFLRTFVAVWLVIPLFTVLVIYLLGVVGTSATLLLLMSVCPGTPAILTFVRMARSSIATAFIALFLTTATEPLLIPYWTRLLSKFLTVDLTIQPKQVFEVLLPTVFVPVLLGFVLHKRFLDKAEALGSASDYVDLVGTGACIVLILGQGVPLIRHVSPVAVAAIVIITAGDAVLGFWAARPNLAEQKAIAAAAALGNPALALVVVEVIYHEMQAAVLVSVYVAVRAVAILPLVAWLRYLSTSTR